MSHLRLVPAPPSRGVTIPAQRRAGDDAEAPAEPDDRVIPARLLLAIAGRCSCSTCCAAYAAGRPEPHDPRQPGERPHAI